MKHGAFLLICALATLSARADAYIDPGTGSYILQMVIAGTLGAVLTLKTQWIRIRGMFRRR